MSSVSFETSMPMLIGDGDDMIDASPLVQFSADPGLRIRARRPTQLFGLCKETAWRCLLFYGFNEPSPESLCHAELNTNDDSIALYHLLGDTSPALGTESKRSASP